MDEDKLAFEEELDELVAKFIQRHVSLLDISNIMELKLHTVNEAIGMDTAPIARLAVGTVMQGLKGL